MTTSLEVMRLPSTVTTNIDMKLCNFMPVAVTIISMFSISSPLANFIPFFVNVSILSVYINVLFSEIDLKNSPSVSKQTRWFQTLYLKRYHIM